MARTMGSIVYPVIIDRLRVTEEMAARIHRAHTRLVGTRRPDALRTIIARGLTALERDMDTTRQAVTAIMRAADLATLCELLNTDVDAERHRNEDDPHWSPSNSAAVQALLPTLPSWGDSPDQMDHEVYSWDADRVLRWCDTASRMIDCTGREVEGGEWYLDDRGDLEEEIDIDDEAIRQLRAEAGSAGDDAMVAVCDVAIGDHPHGYAALAHAGARGLSLKKYGDPIEEARDDLSIADATEVCEEDCSLIYVVSDLSSSDARRECARVIAEARATNKRI